MKKNISGPVLGPGILMGPTGPMLSQHRLWSHGQQGMQIKVQSKNGIKGIVTRNTVQKSV